MTFKLSPSGRWFIRICALGTIILLLISADYSRRRYLAAEQENDILLKEIQALKP